MACRGSVLTPYVLLAVTAVIWSCQGAPQAASWSGYLEQRYPGDKASFPIILCVVEETQAASFLPIFVTSILALPGRLENSLTVVATSPSAKAVCDQIHPGCFLEEQVFNHKHVNFTGSKAFKSNPSNVPASRTKVNRTAESLQITWGKVSSSVLLTLHEGRLQASQFLVLNARTPKARE